MPKKKKTYVHPDTSRAQESKSVHFNTKELNIKKQLEKKKEVKERDVFDFSEKNKLSKK
tara:strand:+ start:797 stop:973 length:177 start_codon:yes stop_codon:yes gene_type:complete